jgi:hypothetical protein
MEAFESGEGIGGGPCRRSDMGVEKPGKVHSVRYWDLYGITRGSCSFAFSPGPGLRIMRHSKAKTYPTTVRDNIVAFIIYRQRGPGAMRSMDAEKASEDQLGFRSACPFLAVSSHQAYKCIQTFYPVRFVRHDDIHPQATNLKSLATALSSNRRYTATIPRSH